MVDKNGKLFGKINLIDLIIVLVLIALAAFAVFKVSNKNADNSSISKVRISFFAEEVPEYVTKVIEKGSSVLDSTEKVTMGTVESFEVGDPLGYMTNTKGEIESVQREGYKSLSLDIISDAKITEHGAEIGGVLYGVGHSLTIYAGKAKIYLKISAIEPVA